MLPDVTSDMHYNMIPIGEDKYHAQRMWEVNAAEKRTWQPINMSPPSLLPRFLIGLTPLLPGRNGQRCGAVKLAHRGPQAEERLWGGAK